MFLLMLHYAKIALQISFKGNNMNFLPVILGTDLNTYGVARAFHEAYGITSQAFGSAKLIQTLHSKIVEVTAVDGFADDEVFLETLVAFGLENKGTDLILFAASDNYAQRIFKHQDVLSEFYFIPYLDAADGIKYGVKTDFYELCEKFDIPYPKTINVNADNYLEHQNSIDYPVILKSSETPDYFNMDFEGKEKVYIIHDEVRYIEVCEMIYGAGYGHDMLLQDFVPGSDTDEYVINAYADRNHELKLLSVGRNLLSDPDPLLKGNYYAITNANEEDPSVAAIYENVAILCKEMNFKGLFNFDIKWDSVAKEFKFFEMNMRQGYSSFFSVVAGANFAVPIVNDIYGIEADIIKNDREFIWINCHKKVFHKVMKDNLPELYAEVSHIDNIKKTMDYSKDKSIQRRLAIANFYNRRDQVLLDAFEN